ncbi:MAG TPA: alpha/beta hydrolase [Acidimicrobiales bacterium]|nr:alpha/beta hydrolase [Acidimicrobiales bacterium]
MASSVAPRADHLVWKRTSVLDRVAMYGVAGPDGGIPVVFLHGWALGSHTYKRALKRLAHLGCRVFAPALPGFGGTADLGGDDLSIEGYARWVGAFLDAVDLHRKVILVGHSFGGGVAIETAYGFPDRVRTLVLINSIGGSAWSTSGSTVRSMAERPLWDWGIHFPRDILPLPQLRRVLPVILEDAVPNVIRNPRAVWRVAHLARRADLTPELEELKRRKLPVVVLWGEDDKIITRDSFDALCLAIGSPGAVVAGNHSWLLADPDSFGEVMTNVIGVAEVAREEEARRPRRRSRRPRELASFDSGAPDDEAAS